jgi:hypothetical protein
MLAKRIFLILLLTAFAATSPTIQHAQSDQEQQQPPAQRLKGSWIITVTAVVPPGVPPPPVRTNYTSFASGGVSIGSDRLAPFSNPQHGVWQHVHGDEFLWTFIGDSFSATGTGVFVGTLKVRNKITLTGPDTFIGVNNAELRDANGNLLFSACNTLRGERIQIEPLPAQCDAIIAPQ